MPDPLVPIWENMPNRLTQIQLIKLRCFNGEKINFEYPISVICGANGTGKTSIIAAAACAYSNGYTPGDFFRGSRIDGYSEEAEINFTYLHRVSGSLPGIDTVQTNHRLHKFSDPLTGARLRWVSEGRTKITGRPIKDVYYFSLNRALATYERQNLARRLEEVPIREFVNLTEEKIESLAEIMDNPTLKARVKDLRGAKGYGLKFGSNREFSSLHMGTGQEVVIGLVDRINDVPSHSLILIDEVEVGLHPEWQCKLIGYLKDVVATKRCQIIVTSHSPYIIDGLPIAARILVERFASKLVIFNHTTSNYALRVMGGSGGKGLTILLEDAATEELVRAALPSDLRKQVLFQQVGDKANLGKHLGVHYETKQNGQNDNDFLIIADGGTNRGEVLTNFNSALSHRRRGTTATNWFDEHYILIPGDSAPEAFIATKLLTMDDLSGKIGLPEGMLEEITRFFLAGENDIHRFFAHLAQNAGLPIETITQMLTLEVVDAHRSEFDPLVAKIGELIRNLS